MSGEVDGHGFVQRGDFGGADPEKQAHDEVDDPEGRANHRSTEWKISAIWNGKFPSHFCSTLDIALSLDPFVSFVICQRTKTKYNSDLSLQPPDRKNLSLCKGELRIEMALKSIPFGI